MEKQHRLNKTKLVTTIICTLVILLAMGLGVYAIVSGATDIKGTVTYHANSVYAGVFGTVSGYHVGEEVLPDFSDAISPYATEGTSKNWNIGNVNFSKETIDWQNKVDSSGLPVYGQKQPTITIRLAITNMAIYDADNTGSDKIYIGDMVAPSTNSNIEYSYRMGYGAIDTSKANWKSSFQDLSTIETFTVQEREYFNLEDIYLNDAENGLFLNPIQDNVMEYYVLEVKIRIKDTSVDINNFKFNLTINMSAIPFE